MAWVISVDIKNEREMDCARVPGVGDRRLRRPGIKEEPAPDVETLPTSS